MSVELVSTTDVLITILLSFAQVDGEVKRKRLDGSPQSGIAPLSFLRLIPIPLTEHINLENSKEKQLGKKKKGRGRGRGAM